MLHFAKDFQAFWTPNPKKFPGALRAPETFIFLMVFKVSEPLFGVWCRLASSGRAWAGNLVALELLDLLVLRDPLGGGRAPPP